MISTKKIQSIKKRTPHWLHKILYSLSHVLYIFAYKPPRLKNLDYNEYWGYRTSVYKNKPYVEPQHKLIVDLLPEKGTILDIGCGDGSFILYAQKKRPKLLFEGIDLSKTAVKTAKIRGVIANVKDITRESNTIKKYDFLILAEILEHVSNPEEIMKIIKTKYRKGIILTIPNIAWGWYRLRLLFGKFPMDWLYHPGEHIRFWSLPDLKWWLTKAFKEDFSFKIIKVIPRGGLPVLNRVWPNLFAKGFVVLIS